MSEIKTASRSASLRRRPATPADESWLRQLFAQLRGLDPALLAACPAVLEQQWQLQQRVFASRYPGARTEVLLLEDRPVGLVTLHESDSSMRILELGLDSRYRGQGLGDDLLSSIVRDADARGKALELAVMRHNPALRLYRRLGFRPLPDGGDEVQVQMRRAPGHRV
ncbi:GNAT family N-acetyltransferase [Pseudomonas sp. Q1-7]|uniref:GNAT family N-acetyltransferase n=1 Tax=Pseudomonas sp. Q1-7 TaxID=3020843 RepID=UPI002300B5CC|nr:GNAT family N-acetyltransferase [Pseudomonas sp. Q1-7]